MELEFYTIYEMANILNVHHQTIRNAIRAGRIQAFRVGQGKRSAFRIPKSEIQRMAAFDATQVIDKIVKKEVERALAKNKKGEK